MRIRTVKPEWLEDERLALASPLARVMSIALILLADDEGRGRGNPTTLAGRVFPGSENPREDSTKALSELVQLRFVIMFESDGQTYFQIRNWSKHQRVDKVTPSRLPAPPPEPANENATITVTLPVLAKVREDSRGVEESSRMFAPDLGSGSGSRIRNKDMSESEPPTSFAGSVRKVFDVWLSEHVDPSQHRKCKLNGKRRRAIEARFREGYEPERLIDAIRGVKLSPFHMGENDAGKFYTDLTTILRDGSQVEKFEALLAEPPRPAARPGGMRPPSPDSHFQPDGDSDEYINSLFGPEVARA